MFNKIILILHNLPRNSYGQLTGWGGQGEPAQNAHTGTVTPCSFSCQRQTSLGSSMYMKHKTSLPEGLKNIFQEEQNACGKVVCECKVMKERRT